MFRACQFTLLQQGVLLPHPSRELWGDLLEWLGPVLAGGNAGSSRRSSLRHSQLGWMHSALPPLGECAVRALKAPAGLPWALGVTALFRSVTWLLREGQDEE